MLQIVYARIMHAIVSVYGVESVRDKKLTAYGQVKNGDPIPLL